MTEDADGKPKGTDYDTLAFKLEVKCERNLAVDKDETDPHRAYKHANGTADDAALIHSL